MSTIDLDHPGRPVIHRGARYGAIAAVVLALTASLAGATTVARPTTVVTVHAIPADGAAARIVTSGGSVEPEWGQPTRVTDLRSVQIITWAGDRGATCTIIIDGRVAASMVEGAAGRPASCVWP